MFEFKLNATDAVFTNTKTHKEEKIGLLDVVSTEKAVGLLTAEVKAAMSGSAAAVSLLNTLLSNPRCASWKGTVPVTENVPKELKSAIRDLEVAVLRPVFVDQLMNKVPADAPDAVRHSQMAKAEERFQQWCSNALRTGGAYAQAKSKATAFFAHCGKLPEVVVGEGEDMKTRLLSVAAMEKLVQNAREAAQKQASGNEGISQKLVALNVDLNARSERTKLGSYPEAIRALKDMLATFEKLNTELEEQRTAAGGGATGSSVADATQDAIEKAKQVEQPTAEVAPN